MNVLLFVQGWIEIGISVVTGLIIFLLAFKVFTVLTRDIDEMAEIKNNNIAVAILISSFVFGVMWIVSCSMAPAKETLSAILAANKVVGAIVVIGIFRIFLFYIISGIFAFVLLWFSIKLFMIMTTNIDEMKQIKNNNIAVSLVIGTLIVSLSILLTHSTNTILTSVMPATRNAIEGTKDSFINVGTLVHGSLELAITLVGALLIFFLSFKLLALLTKNIDDIEELKSNNLSLAFVSSSFTFGIMLLIKVAVLPAYKELDFLFSKDTLALGAVIISFVKVLAFFLSSSIFSFLTIWISINIFMIFTTKLDEMAEIKNKNIAVSIVLAVLIISVAFLLQFGLATLYDSFANYPQIANEGGVITL